MGQRRSKDTNSCSPRCVTTLTLIIFKQKVQGSLERTAGFSPCSLSSRTFMSFLFSEQLKQGVDGPFYGHQRLEIYHFDRNEIEVTLFCYLMNPFEF